MESFLKFIESLKFFCAKKFIEMLLRPDKMLKFVIWPTTKKGWRSLVYCVMCILV